MTTNIPMKTRDAAILGIFLALTLACYLPHAPESFVGLDSGSYEQVLWTTSPLQTALDVLVDLKGNIVPGYYAPLGSLSLIGDRLLAGSVQSIPKFTFIANLTLHCINALLLWWLLRSLGFGEAVTLVSVFVFLIHPMQVSVVGWFAERKTLLSVTFYFLSYLMYAKAGFAGWARAYASSSAFSLANNGQHGKYSGAGPQSTEDSQWKRIVLYVMSLFAFVIGVLTKPTASVFPLIWIWGAVFDLRREPFNVPSGGIVAAKYHLSRLWAVLEPLIPFFVVAVLIGSLAVFSETNPPRLPISERLPIIGAGVLFYVHKAVAPVDLMYLYPRWQVDTYSLWWWLPFLVISAAVILLYRYKESFSQAFTWGVGNFLIPLLPAAGIISFGFFQYSFVGNHLAYLSIAGAAACMGSLFVAGVRGTSRPFSMLIIVFGIAYSGFLVSQTWSGTLMWQSPIKLLEDNVRKCPSCIDARGVYGGALLEEGRYREAIFNLELAVAGKPDSATYEHNLGEAKMKLGDMQGAVRHYVKALQVNPRHARSHISLGVAYQSLGDMQRSVEEFQRAAGLAPHLVEPHYDLALAQHQSGKIEEAIMNYRKVLRLDPAHFMAHNNIGAAYLSMGQPEKAQVHFRKALAIRPDSEFALKNLEKVREEIARQQEMVGVKPPEASGPERPPSR